ncbi:ribosome small subunit-dependent GTPase A [Arthrobacter sp. TMN-37]
MATLEDYGYTDGVRRRFEAHFATPFPGPRSAEDQAPAPASELRPARVVRVDRRQLLVAEAYRLATVPAGGAVAAGDWVALGGDPGRPPVVQVLPRTGVLQRKKAHDPLSEAQLVAANVEVALIVVPIDRPLSANRLERTLVAARDAGARPLVVLTKADLTGVHDPVVGQTVEQAGTAEVITTSARTGDGCGTLAGSLRPGETCVLIGPSGAGKSALVNALVGTPVQDTGRVRAWDGKGRHTTTARTLVPLRDGVVLIDTPGVRGFALWDADEGLDAEFSDITGLASGCRYRDCAHDGEPGCAVAAALADGSLEERRWASYRRMARELADLHRRQDAARRRPAGRGRSSMGG